MGTRVAKGGRHWRILLVALAFVGGVATASYDDWRLTAQQLVLATGAAHLTRLEAVQPIGYRSSEYLLILKSAEDLAAAQGFFADHPDIDYHGESIFPRTLRIGLKVPVANTKRELEAQAFSSGVVRNHLLFFCQ